jgi:dihydropyrimidine dehydrogenase (NADP+)
LAFWNQAIDFSLRTFGEMRAVDEEVDLAKHEDCEFLPFSSPKKVIMENGKVVGLELYKTEKGKPLFPE